MSLRLKKVGRRRSTKNGFQNPARREVMEYWENLNTVFNTNGEVELFGKKWLELNGFDYVWWFGEHDNTRQKKSKQKKYVLHPFDYYAEKDGDSWLIDATYFWRKQLNKSVLEPYLRRNRMAVLFIYPNGKRVILKEINRVTGAIYLGKRELGLNLRKDGYPLGRPRVEVIRNKRLIIVDEENLPDLEKLREQL